MNETIQKSDENVVDLFSHYEELPEAAKEILKKFEDFDLTYTGCESLLKELEKVGYTFEYYLDAVPFNLTKI